MSSSATRTPVRPSERPRAHLRLRRPSLWLTALAISLLLGSSTGFILHERQQVLEQAQATATRRVNRLAQDLAQSLTLARQAIDMTATLAEQSGGDRASLERLLRQRSDLLSVLPLPFEMRALAADGSYVDLAKALATDVPPHGAHPAGSGRWQAQSPLITGPREVLPLDWVQPQEATAGIRSYSVAFDMKALLRRLEQDRPPQGGGAALFRLDPDGQITVLARAPLQDGQLGRQIGGWLARTLTTQERGVFATPGELDGVRRRTAFTRLKAPADTLVVAYGFAEDDVLADWSRRWPWAALATALLALALGWAGWRLDRSQTRLTRSELRLRLALASDQIWEWDLRTGVLRLPEFLWRGLGHAQPAPHDMAKFIVSLVWPEDLQPLLDRLRRHFRDHEPLAAEFRLRDAQGDPHWFATQGQAEWNAAGRAVYVAGTAFETTERHRLEQEQRQLLQHLDTVANASSTLSWTVDVHQRPDWLNQAWLNFTGRDLFTECETFWLEDLHPQDRERSEKIFNEAFAARQPYSMEYRLLRHDGQYRWLHEQGKPRYDADGQFIGYVGSCLDVTDLREAEASARERDAMLKQVFDVLRDMLFVLDAQERFVFFQSGAEDRLYRRPQDFLGQPLDEVMPADLVTQLRTAMQRARAGGVQEVDYSLEMPTGVRFFNARLAWLPGDGQCMFLVRDTTEQQTALRARKRLNDFVLILFRLASRFINLPLQQMDEAIDAALRDMGVFVRADRAYLFSYDHAAGTATNTHEWCGPGIGSLKDAWQAEPIRRLAEGYQKHLSGERMEVVDAQALPAGAVKDELTATGIRSMLTLPLMDGETCLGFVGLDVVQQAREYGQEEVTLLELFAQMLVNIRLRAQAAAQVREMTERLEQKVEERTQQLNESVQRLQAVNRELESFTYSASHDLRTPLRGIEGFSALLLEEHARQLDAQGREYLQRIQRASLHMSRLVSDLLAYSRLQQMTARAEPVEVASSVQAVLDPFQDELLARQASVTVDVPEALRVRADPQGLAIVLRNLLDNALKFTPARRSPQLRIAARAEGDRVHLSVSDTGMGFDMRYHDRIFGMFQRLHRQDQIPGTGIGLALVHKAVQRMGGHIRAESAPGKGTTFHLDLPRA